MGEGTLDETAVQHVRNALFILEEMRIVYPKIDEALGKPWRVAYEPADIAAAIKRLGTAIKLLGNLDDVR